MTTLSAPKARLVWALHCLVARFRTQEARAYVLSFGTLARHVTRSAAPVTFEAVDNFRRIVRVVEVPRYP